MREQVKVEERGSKFRERYKEASIGRETRKHSQRGGMYKGASTDKEII